MRTRIKICGLRSASEVSDCVDAGVDMVGFNFWTGSRRHVPPAAAAAFVKLLPRAVLPVGVFVGAPPDEVARAIGLSLVRAVQLHGDEDPKLYMGLGVEVIPVFRLKSRSSLPATPPPLAVQRVMLDAWVEGFGGKGKTFDWSLVPEARARLGRDIIVAGGLTPENVGELVRRARPWGVDVASGVEGLPGVKDRARVRAFVQAVRAAETER